MLLENRSQKVKGGFRSFCHFIGNFVPYETKTLREDAYFAPKENGC